MAFKKLHSPGSRSGITFSLNSAVCQCFGCLNEVSNCGAFLTSIKMTGGTLRQKETKRRQTESYISLINIIDIMDLIDILDLKYNMNLIDIMDLIDIMAILSFNSPNVRLRSDLKIKCKVLPYIKNIT